MLSFESEPLAVQADSEHSESCPDLRAGIDIEQLCSILGKFFRAVLLRASRAVSDRYSAGHKKWRVSAAFLLRSHRLCLQ